MMVEKAGKGSLEVTKVYITPAFKREGRTRLRAYVSIVLNDSFMVKNIRIIEKKEVKPGESKYFIVFPNRENTRPCTACSAKVSFRDEFCKVCGTKLSPIIQEATYKDLCHPIKRDVSDVLEKCILDEYTKFQEKMVAGAK
jgi:DNA-binding cell septation regulator SpoVG